MEKKFNEWNEEKKKLDGSDRMVEFHEREIWWCSIGVFEKIIDFIKGLL